MYDVIVVGAGATGCTAAKTLSENGYKVLLVEKFKMPRYKSCSGQLIKKLSIWCRNISAWRFRLRSCVPLLKTGE